MKKIFFRNTYGFRIVCLLLTLASVSMLSCNKDFEDTLKGQSAEDSSSLDIGQRKVLLIILDGAVGSEVRTIAPVNLTLMGDFSIHSYDALADYKGAEDMSDARGWTTLLTGVSPAKHGVTGADFTGNNLDQYPTFFTRFRQVRPDLKTAAFVSSPELADNLLGDATEKKSFNGDDAAVKNAVVSELGSDDNTSLIMAEFSGIAKAGDQGSYEAADPGYKSAVITTDGYIGEILTSMRNRDNFENENWLVIVTSDRGSEIASNPGGAVQNAYSDSRRNTLFFLYNPRFKSQSLLKPGTQLPYIGTAPMYNGNDDASIAQVNDDGGLYDFGETGSFTIQCKVKIPKGSYAYPAILGKRNSFDGGVPGWVIFLEGDLWQVNFGQVGQGNSQIKGQSIADGKWHTLTVVITQDGAARNVRTYTDGIYSGNSANIAGKGNLNSPAPLRVGSIPGSRNGGQYSPVDYFVTDIRIYDAALSEDYMSANACKISIPDTDPYKNDVLGFWPSTFENDIPKQTLTDYSGNNKDFEINKLNAVSFSDISPNICPDVSETVYKIVPNSIDIATQLYQWFGVLISKDWKLEGKSFVPEYIDLKN